MKRVDEILALIVITSYSIHYTKLYDDTQIQWEKVAENYAQHGISLPQPEKWSKCTLNLRAVIDQYLALNAVLNQGNGMSYNFV